MAEHETSLSKRNGTDEAELGENRMHEVKIRLSAAGILDPPQPVMPDAERCPNLVPNNTDLPGRCLPQTSNCLFRSSSFKHSTATISGPIMNTNYSVACAHIPVEQKSDCSIRSKKSVRSVVIQPARKALVRIYHALLTGLVNSAPMPLPSGGEIANGSAMSTSRPSADSMSPSEAIHPAFRKRQSNEWSDDDLKAQHRLARFFPQYDPAMDGYKSLPSEVAVKLAEVDKRFSMESQRSAEERRSFDLNAERLDISEIFKQKRRDSGLSIDTVEEVQVAKAVPLRRAVRKSFYPPPRPISK
ncbi:hypothetical protein M409DRAFT_53987 [Zasmidium cellare ATCC 36951]|uniref:Uncharacterized protein n=1 Tax=Zasmidium cellare ATCC 36951 TaxID=1080233 RepID=A0A6A6CL84_ZASCE|nr:uncharacterized protein M409DRAFT_53987 [Zasmidium cellare ATCC 36951]KAF2167383.1 hypothetical protein M409DRAFT_53987 [Zasmidium cellare ATCC 36951]